MTIFVPLCKKINQLTYLKTKIQDSDEENLYYDAVAVELCSDSNGSAR